MVEALNAKTFRVFPRAYKSFFPWWRLLTQKLKSFFTIQTTVAYPATTQAPTTSRRSAALSASYSSKVGPWMTRWDVRQWRFSPHSLQFRLLLGEVGAVFSAVAWGVPTADVAHEWRLFLRLSLSLLRDLEAIHAELDPPSVAPPTKRRKYCDA